MDEVDFPLVERTVAFMRRLGIVRLGSIELGPAPAAPVEEPLAIPPIDLDALLKGSPEGDDALFWSVSGPLPSEARSADKAPEE